MTGRIVEPLPFRIGSEIEWHERRPRGVERCRGFVQTCQLVAAETIVLLVRRAEREEMVRLLAMRMEASPDGERWEVARVDPDYARRLAAAIARGAAPRLPIEEQLRTLAEGALVLAAEAAVPLAPEVSNG